MIKVAILGAGIGREHLEAYRKLQDQFQVTVIADRDTTRAELLRHGDSFRVVDTIEAAIASDVNVIDVCLPPHLHVPATVQALEAGKHVICEKPLAPSLDGVAEIERAAAASGRQVFPVFQYRWGPSLAQLRSLIDAGLTGQPQVAALETHWSRGADYYAVPWRGTWQGENGGAVLGHAIHNHDLLTHFFGPVDKVSASLTTRVNSIETEDCAALQFQMANGAVATSSVTLGAAGDETRIRFVFEKLTATSGSAPYAPGMDAWTFTARDPAHQGAVAQVLSKSGTGPTGFDGFLAAVGRVLNGDPRNAVDLEAGRASIELVSAIYKSNQTGQMVTLPLHDDDPYQKGWQP